MHPANKEGSSGGSACPLLLPRSPSQLLAAQGKAAAAGGTQVRQPGRTQDPDAQRSSSLGPPGLQRLEVLQTVPDGLLCLLPGEPGKVSIPAAALELLLKQPKCSVRRIQLKAGNLMAPESVGIMP